MKRRIQEISKKTSTKKYVFGPTLLMLVLAFALGCGMPSDKSWIKSGEWTDGDTEEELYFESEYEYSLQENIKSQLFYFEVYQYGELTERNILAYGSIEDSKNTILVRYEMPKTLEEGRIVLESNGIGIEIPSSLSKYPGTGGKAYDSLQSDDRIEIISEESLILNAIYKTENGSIQSYDCKELSGYTELQMQRGLKDNYAVGFCRVVFSELPVKELSEKYSQMEYLGSNEQAEASDTEAQLLVSKWAEAFVNRDAQNLVSMATEAAKQQMLDNAIMDESLKSFGWSSPWPMFGDELYRIVSCDENGAEILYYASDSTPHLTVWQEKLGFEEVDGKLAVSSWQIHWCDAIYKIEDFYIAYPNKEISGTPMDYYTNGLGEALNKNAMLSSSMEYRELFEPITSAAKLLNINTDKELTSFVAKATDVETMVHISFLNDNGSSDLVEIAMWQPYGESGIWIPK